MKCYLTFGQQSPLRNGWIEVEASTYGEARELVHGVFGTHWASLYKEEEFKKEYFPSGKIGETLI